MRIEEAILYVLVENNGGLRTQQIADIINRRRLHVRKDNQPVTSAQVYAVVMHHPDTFVKAEGRIMLMIQSKNIPAYRREPRWRFDTSAVARDVQERDSLRKGVESGIERLAQKKRPANRDACRAKELRSFTIRYS